MYNLLTKTSFNYSIQTTRYRLGVFTQYSGSYYSKVQASNRWQPQAVLLSTFIAAFSFLKPIYIGIKGAVNYVQFNTLWQYNKSFVRDCQNASFVLPVRCAAPQLKRYIVKS